MDSMLSAKEGGSKKRFLTMKERMSRADLMTSFTMLLRRFGPVYL